MKQRLQHLIQIWTYGDGQPTEITLAMINIVLTPITLYLEVGCFGVFGVFLIASGLHQLWCISCDNLSCRIRGAFFTFSAYLGTLVMYLGSIGLPTPSHWGWLVLIFASFFSLLRIKKEQLRRGL
jgi:hypothetical protein